MFGLFKKNGAKDINGNEVRDTYDPDRVTVFYQGEVLSADYTAATLVLTGVIH